jgi:hypothetical protein
MSSSRVRAVGWLAAAAAVAAVAVSVALTLASATGGGRVQVTTTPIAVPTPATTVNPVKAPSLPARGAYFGAYVQPVAYTQAADIAAIQTLQGQIGRRLRIVHSYLRWQVPFPTASQQAILRQGSMLLLSWAGADTRAIASGVYDSWIREQARAIKATHKRIFLEWRWEMNRPGLLPEIHSPADYIKAWDHIRSIFASQHVKNVAWVWCPSVKGFGLSFRYASGADFYPGNKEVDWLCVDAYPQPGKFVSFADLVEPFLAWASHIPKPIMIGEFGVPRSYAPRVRARWLRAAAQAVRADPQIKALVYFDGDPRGGVPDKEYGLDAGSPPLLAFSAIAQDKYFNLPRRRWEQ